MRKLRWVLLILVVLLLGAQAVRPDMQLPPADPSHDLHSAMQVPVQVDAILKRSCYDCHSRYTRWPWYAKIAPSSWLLASDVNDGRNAMSFSEFATYTPRKQAKRLDNICDEVKKGEMPLWFYLPLHPAAKLSDADKLTLCTWGEQARAQIFAAHPDAAKPAKPGQGV